MGENLNLVDYQGDHKEDDRRSQLAACVEAYNGIFDPGVFEDTTELVTYEKYKELIKPGFEEKLRSILEKACQFAEAKSLEMDTVPGTEETFDDEVLSQFKRALDSFGMTDNPDLDIIVEALIKNSQEMAEAAGEEYKYTHRPGPLEDIFQPTKSSKLRMDAALKGQRIKDNNTARCDAVRDIVGELKEKWKDTSSGVMPMNFE